MEVKALTEVTSSTIASMGHSNVDNIMTVKFKNGSIYTYSNVSPELYNEILGAESVGKAFDAKIKKQASAHPYQKVS